MSAAIVRVSAPEGAELLAQGYVYLDVRTEEEYAGGHPAGALNVPFMASASGRLVQNPDFLAVARAVLPAAERVLVGCAAGGRSIKAAQAMLDAGFTCVVDLRPGYGGARNAFGQIVEPGWLAAGLPTELVTAGKSYAELARLAKA